MKSKIFELVFRIIIILSAILGLFVFYNPYGVGMQFWFFTVQTNMFVVIVELFLCIGLILDIFKIKNNLIRNKLFSTTRLMVTFFITITGVIYCFVLAPAGILFGGKSVTLMLGVRNILLHVVVPILSVVGYYKFCPKEQLSKHYAFLFLIYPFVYFIMVNLRVWLGGAAFYDGTLYPYFFIDPTINNQGWGMVAIYICVIIAMFYGLARLYIYANNKIAKSKKNSKKIVK